MQEEIKNFLAQWSATGLAGGLAIHFYASNERTLALLSAIVTTLTALWATFSKGFMGEMNKIVDQAGKSFAQWLAKWLPETLKFSWQRIIFQHKYYQSLVDTYRAFRMEGLITRSPLTPDLEKVFVPLQVIPQSPEKISHSLFPDSNLPDINTQSSSSELNIWNFLAMMNDQPGTGSV